MNRSTLAWLLLAVALLVAPRAQAACTMNISPVNFGTFNPVIASTTDMNGQVNVDCDNFLQSVEIALSKGNNTFAVRQMKSGTAPFETLNYNLYTDAAHATIFGDGSAGTDTAQCYTGVATGTCTSPFLSRRASQPIYGRLVGPQDVGVGNYTDTITVTVTF